LYPVCVLLRLVVQGRADGSLGLVGWTLQTPGLGALGQMRLQQVLVVWHETGKGLQGAGAGADVVTYPVTTILKVGRQHGQPQVQITIKLPGRKHRQCGRQGQHLRLQLGRGSMGGAACDPLQPVARCPDTLCAGAGQSQRRRATGRSEQDADRLLHLFEMYPCIGMLGTCQTGNGQMPPATNPFFHQRWSCRNA
jgi:hypothetical protein